jgi:hypothetical protein
MVVMMLSSGVSAPLARTVAVLAGDEAIIHADANASITF